MDNFLSMLPKSLLAFVAITAGMVFIVIAYPPASVCDSQMEIIKEAQNNFLFKDEKWPKSKVIKSTKFEYLRDLCKSTNNPGGCLELFQETKILLHDLSTLTRECGPVAGGLKEIKRALWETMDLLLRLAWGENPPEAYHSKFGWLDTADISLYCKLKGAIQNLYGEPQWTAFREKMMKDLPGAKALPRNQVWDMSLFSENCNRYP
jgi:hypothetical protein